jgi:hypothetical protein
MPVEKRMVTGVWVGLTVEANDFYRLLLLEGGSGVLGTTFVGKEPLLYKITSWKLKSGNLKIVVTPISTNAYPIVVDGTAVPSHITLKIKDPKGGWSRQVVLYKEQLIEDRIAMLKEAMQAIK